MKKTNSLLLIMVPLMLILFVSSLDQTIVATALPSIAKSLAQPQYVAWTTTAYLLTSSVTTLLFGRLGDQQGRKIVLQVSLVIFLLGSALAGLAPTMLFLIVMRAFQGIGGGGLTALVQATVGDLVPARERGAYQALLGIVPSLAVIAGPFLGGFIAQTVSWRWIFYINVPVGVLAFVLLGTLLHLPKVRKVGQVDFLGGFLATLFTTSLLLMTTWGGNTVAWTSPLIIGLIVLAVLSMLGFIFVERRRKQAILPLGLFKKSVFAISSLQFALASFVLFVLMLFTPMYLQTVRGFSASRAGLVIIPMMLGLVVGSAVTGPIITKTGKYKIYPIIGSFLMGISSLFLGMLTVRTSLLELIALLVLSGIGQGLMIQVALLAGQNAAPYQDLGAATGALNFFKSLGGAFAAAIMGTLLNDGMKHLTAVAAFGRLYSWLVPLMLVSFVLAVLMKELPLSDAMISVLKEEVDVPEY
ncbi:MDR family MFS transporter [Lactococcus nasutitermitis]|uniref:MDR family MFS transporter n=1 Tax=Lactococcus nasutitermitis TaxID=1652957 RepID=A0ABV9JAT9_9LACT|nr:MDR family MFS transporter [Lactococcus nasutitermitis]